mmetsp:Transcript_32482/g.44524  ORF Transcript_32482/g.44524 Transcript_32482/m.44524 type:complete len:595 (-) Transcript_32482:20-1804(-)
MGSGLSGNPFTAWMMESSVNDTDHRKITTVPNTLGSFCGILTGFICLQISPFIASVGAILSSASVYFLITFVPNVVHCKRESLPPIVPSIRIASRTKEFRNIFLNRVLIGSATSIFTSSASLLLLIGFSNIHTQKDFVFYSVCMGIVSGTVGVCIVVALNWYLTLVDKLTVYLRVTKFVTIASFVGFIATLGTNMPCFILYYLMNMSIGIMYHPIAVIESFMLRDLILYDTYSTGLNRENAYVTAITLPSSVLVSFFGAIPLCMLTLTGFQQIQHSSGPHTDDHISSLYKWNDSSLWTLRCFGTLAVTLLAAYSYLVIKNHSITQLVANKLNEIVREDEKLNPLNAEAVAMQEIGVNSRRVGTLKPADEGSRMLLLHFSMSELQQLVESSSSMTSLLIRLLSMYRRTVFATTTSAMAAVLMLAVCCVDAIYAQGSFSTLLLALSLLSLAYSLYEALRVVALLEVQRSLQDGCWTALQLCTLVKVVMEDFKERGCSVSEDLKRVTGFDSTEGQDKNVRNDECVDGVSNEDSSTKAFVLMSPLRYRGYRQVNEEVEVSRSDLVINHVIGTDSYIGLAMIFSCAIFLCCAILWHDLY